MYVVFKLKTEDAGYAVLRHGRSWGAMTEITRNMEESYAKTTWKRIVPQIGAVLNTFFATPTPDVEPAVFTDRHDGQAAIREALEKLECTFRRKRPSRFGYMVEHPTRAKQIDTMICLGRVIFEECYDAGLTSVENPFVIEGWTPAHEKQLRSIKRENRRSNPAGTHDFKVETGRFFSVASTGWVPKRTDDPKYRERIDAKLAIHSPPGTLAAHRTQHALWCRPSEAITMPFRSLQLGAEALGAKGFGQLVKIADKNSNGALVKWAATPPGFTEHFDYIDGPRRAMDPNGWGRADYERECAAGNEAALASPIFLNTRGGGLTYGTANDRTFRKIMRKSRLRYCGKPPTMHLGRHDQITKALEVIDALDVSDEIKERLRADVADYVGWATGVQMLPTYSVHLETRRRARRTVGFQSAHSGTTFADSADRSGRLPDVLRGLFEGRD